MKHSILIIDDERLQAENLEKHLKRVLPKANVVSVYEADSIQNAISDLFFDVAIVDLRMDDFDFNGFDVIKDITDINPFAKIIITSAYLSEYEDDLNEVIQTGKIAGVYSKERFEDFASKIERRVSDVFESIDNSLDVLQEGLRSMYSEVKNEPDPYVKGSKFERFTAYLFSLMGFVKIQKRTRDKSQNEIDLIVRNELSDTFFSKFSPYFLVECKNTIAKIDKNIFIVFKEKLQASNGLSKLGFIITPSGFKRTAYLEAMRTSKDDYKIIFISNNEIDRLIDSHNHLETLKSIIDVQTKDN